MSLFVDALAAHRLTRLVTRDTITASARGWLIRDAYYRAGQIPSEDMANMSYSEWAGVPLTDDAPPKLAEFVTCAWCVGMWVSAGVLAARALMPRTWSRVAVGLACSTMVGAIDRALA